MPCRGANFHIPISTTTRRLSQPPGTLPSGFGEGDAVHWCFANETLSNGDKLEYGAMGKVTGPTAGHADRVNVRFPGNKGPVGCLLTQLSRTWPPPPLPKGWKVNEEAYFAGKNKTFPSGDRLVNGAKGVVTGPSSGGDKMVAVHFPGNKAPVGCFVTCLSRTPPPKPAEQVRHSLRVPGAPPFSLSRHSLRSVSSQAHGAEQRPEV